MRLLLLALLAPLLTLLAACQPEPHEFPARSAAAFHRTCPEGDPVCDCTWDKITRAMTSEDYNAALARFRREGLMDPRLTHARTECLDRAR